ncbi:MAG: DUF2779 domain-containing protein [Erysipelotrichaceae bacterium]
MIRDKDIKMFYRCDRLFYLNYYDNNNVKGLPLLRSDENLLNLYKCKLGIDSIRIGVKNEQNDAYFNNTTDNWFYKMRLTYDDIRIKTPILHRYDNNHIDLFFTISSVNPTNSISINYISTIYVCNKLGIEIDNIYIIYLNSEYVRVGDINVEELFNITPYFFNMNHNQKENIKEYLFNEMLQLEKDISKIHNTLLNEPLDVIRSAKCTKKPKCSYYSHCFPLKELPNNSIFYLYGDNPFKYDEEFKSFKEYDYSKMSLNKVQYAQIMADMNGGIYYDNVALNNFLKNTLQYPLSFLDFEWDTYAIPPYDNMKPLDVICFQYSLDVLDTNEQLKHTNFLSINDCREEFIISLIDNLPKEGSIIAFNALGGEIIRLKELIRQFPVYTQQLESIIDRFVDLQMPFINGMVYDLRMKGQLSVKEILKAVSNLSYDDLEIGEGISAIAYHRIYEKNQDEMILQSLYKYCSLDTYSMYVIYKYLKDILQD